MHLQAYKWKTGRHKWGHSNSYLTYSKIKRSNYNLH